VTAADLAANNNYVGAQFGVNSKPALSSVPTRILVAMRADAVPGFTVLSLTTGGGTELDIVEANAPLTTNSATAHWNNWTQQEYAQISGIDLTKWGVWGCQWNFTTVNGVKQIEMLHQLTPGGPLVIWKSWPVPSATWGNGVYLANQLQCFDSIYGSNTPNCPPVGATLNGAPISATNPVKQEIDWVQFCTTP
jgi:hypothetical protein